MRDIWTDQTVDGDETFWRYFRADRFIDAITNRTLYFASAREFEDRFEGATAVVPPRPVDPRFDLMDGENRAFEQLRRLTKVSCWNRGQCESEAMWKLYASGRKGVAVRTTAGRLAASLRAFRLAPEYGEEEPVWGNVRYVDLAAVRLRADVRERFFLQALRFPE
jgi:hypothetical protein